MSQPTVNSDATNQTDVPVEEVDLLVVGGVKAFVRTVVIAGLTIGLLYAEIGRASCRERV